MRNTILVVCLILIYFLEYPALKLIYPLCEVDYDQFEKFYFLRCKIYEVAFLILFLFVFYNTSGKLKAVSLFVVLQCVSNSIDELIFGIHRYLFADIIIMFICIGVSIWFYKKQKTKDPFYSCLKP